MAQRIEASGYALVPAMALLFGGLSACGGEGGPVVDDVPGAASDAPRAINFAGPAYTAVDGTMFAADAFASGGTEARIDRVKGVQNPDLYRTCRVGDIQVDLPIANGTYDLTLFFAEPDEVERDARVFDVIAEGRTIMDDLDVMLFRDGQIRSGLSVVAPDVNVSDGELSLRFEASAGDPVICAALVRDKMPRASDWQLTWREEFDGPELDRATWNIEEWEPGRVNDEDQAYNARDKNLSIEDGTLIIEAHSEDYDDALYTSGRIQSSGKADFLYGRFEARARLPEGQGTWPAIWMLPSDPFRYATTCSDDEGWQGSKDCDAWPYSG